VHLQTEMNHSNKPFTLQSLVHFDWKVSIGDLSIPVSEFKQLVERQQRFLQHQNDWIELPFEKMKKAYDEISETENMFTQQKATMSDLLRMSITQEEKQHQYIKID